MARSFTAASNQWFTKFALAVSGVPVTMAAWVNLNSLAASRGILGFVAGTSGTNGFQLYVAPTGKVYFDVGSGNAAQSTFLLTTGSWFHVAATGVGSAAALYINGPTNKATGSIGSIFGSPTNTLIADVFESSNFPLDGALAFPAFWKVALSDSDIASLAAGAHPLLVQPANLVACCDLSTGASIEPDIASVNTWTATGTPTTVANPRIYR